MSGALIRLQQSDEENYVSESEDEYTQNEKRLLQKVRRQSNSASESENEVYGIHSDASSDIALSDVEGQEEEDDLLNVKAWGKNKRQYYSTDYVDPDYGSYQDREADLAALEEEEAKLLQKQLIQHMDDADFQLDFITKETESSDKREAEEIIKTDVSKLSKRQKLNLLMKESPEFFGLVEDFKEKFLLAKDFLQPVIQLGKEGKVTECDALDFVKTHYEVILNYCVNISMYLLLKASRVNVQDHPVIKRLYQYRQLLIQLDLIYESVIKLQVEILLDNNKEKAEVNRKKTLQLLKSREDLQPPKKKLKPEAKHKKLVSFNFKKTRQSEEEVEDQDTNIKENDNEDIEEDTGDTRRGITYQIAKNKGLTPHRNKLQRNPRVKHRNKYYKAKIRRRGAIREVRTETSRYGGEFSGIKTTVSKSIKIKS